MGSPRRSLTSAETLAIRRCRDLIVCQRRIQEGTMTAERKEKPAREPFTLEAAERARASGETETAEQKLARHEFEIACLNSEVRALKRTLRELISRLS
jgi:predicted RNase H-like nuclease (RuvC/YqgF family)